MPSKDFIEKYRHFLTAGIDFTGGIIGGAANVFAGHPLDTVKVKMQTYPNKYKNSFVCLRHTFLKERFHGLYAGTVPSLIASCSENAILFCAYGACQRTIKCFVQKESVLDLNALEHALSGCTAAFLMSFVLCPTELVKCRLQVMLEAKSPVSKRPWDMTKDIVKRDGFSGLYKGLGITIYREMVGYFFFFGAIDATRTFFAGKGKSKDDIGAAKTIVSGACGGVAFWVSIFPADVVKSRIQIMAENKSAMHVFRDIVKYEGTRALFKGLGPAVLRTCPATGALYYAYAYSTSMLRSCFDLKD